RFWPWVGWNCGEENVLKYRRVTKCRLYSAKNWLHDRRNHETTQAKHCGPGMRGREKVRLERVVDQYILDLVNKKLPSLAVDRLKIQYPALVGISEAIACTKI